MEGDGAKFGKNDVRIDEFNKAVELAQIMRNTNNERILTERNKFFAQVYLLAQVIRIRYDLGYAFKRFYCGTPSFLTILDNFLDRSLSHTGVKTTGNISHKLVGHIHHLDNKRAMEKNIFQEIQNLLANGRDLCLREETVVENLYKGKFLDVNNTLLIYMRRLVDVWKSTEKPTCQFSDADAIGINISDKKLAVFREVLVDFMYFMVLHSGMKKDDIWSVIQSESLIEKLSLASIRMLGITNANPEKWSETEEKLWESKLLEGIVTLTSFNRNVDFISYLLINLIPLVRCRVITLNEVLFGYVMSLMEKRNDCILGCIEYQHVPSLPDKYDLIRRALYSKLCKIQRRARQIKEVIIKDLSFQNKTQKLHNAIKYHLREQLLYMIYLESWGIYWVVREYWKTETPKMVVSEKDIRNWDTVYSERCLGNLLALQKTIFPGGAKAVTFTESLSVLVQDTDDEVILTAYEEIIYKIRLFEKIAFQTSDGDVSIEYEKESNKNPFLTIRTPKKSSHPMSPVSSGDNLRWKNQSKIRNKSADSRGKESLKEDNLHPNFYTSTGGGATHRHSTKHRQKPNSDECWLKLSRKNKMKQKNYKDLKLNF